MAERLRDTFVPCAPSRASSSFSSSSPLMRCDRTRHVVTLAFRYPAMISCRCTRTNQLLITINFMTMTSRLRRVHGSVTVLVVQCFPSAPSSRAHRLFHGLMRSFASLIFCDSGTPHLPAYIPAVPLQCNHHGTDLVCRTTPSPAITGFMATWIEPQYHDPTARHLSAASEARGLPQCHRDDLWTSHTRSSTLIHSHNLSPYIPD